MTSFQQGYDQQLSACQCCPPIKTPGDSELKPFLIAADAVLSQQYDSPLYLELGQPRLYPPVIKVVRDQEQRGFNAEYKVFNTLRDSGLSMYAFYNWRPVDSNDELSDFLIVTKNKVIALEVKAFKLFENPVTVNIEKLEDVLLKSFEQQSRTRREIQCFLVQHGFSEADVSELPLFSFTVFPNEDESFQPHIPDDFQLKLLANPNIDPVVKSEYTRSVLYEKDYLDKLRDLTEDERVVEDEIQLALRHLLAWFYGSYCYDGIRQPRELAPDSAYSVREELNSAFKPKHKRHRNDSDVAGIFLTQAQMEILDCNEDYLAIVGLPGTGKTYCLIAKMAKLFKEIIEEFQTNGKSNQLIVVIHQNISTLQHMEDLFLHCISRFSNSDSSECFIRFISSDDLKHFSCDDDVQLNIFFDDYYVKPQEMKYISLLLRRAKFCWYASYTTSWRYFPLRPLSLMKIEDDLLHEQGKLAVLSRTLRFSSQIHTIAEQLLAYVQKDRYTPLMKEFGTLFHYESGTRVVGDDVTMKGVKDEDEVYEAIAQMLPDLLKRYPPQNIWVLYTIGFSEEKLRASCSEALAIKCCFFLDKLGQEADCVIHPFMTSFHSDSLNTVTRAVSKLIIVYIEGNSTMSEIVSGQRTPSIPRGKMRTGSIIQNRTPMPIKSIMRDDVLYVQNFAYSLHMAEDICKDEDVTGGVICSLACVKKSFSSIDIFNSPCAIWFEETCHYIHVISEVSECLKRLRSRAKESEAEWWTSNQVKNLHSRIHSCLCDSHHGYLPLVEWTNELRGDTSSKEPISVHIKYHPLRSLIRATRVPLDFVCKFGRQHFHQEPSISGLEKLQELLILFRDSFR